MRSLRPSFSVVRILALVLGLACFSGAVQATSVRVVKDTRGQRLQVDGKDFMVLGVNWDYVPIGQNYSYSLWNQPDAFIQEALEREMPLLQAMGVNAIRVYAGIPPRWVSHIYQRYGIATILNHSMGRYGLTLDGSWVPVTDYADPRVHALLLSEMEALVAQYKDTPGLLLWLLGNENNYGLSWTSAATENIPAEERGNWRARHMYRLLGEVAARVKTLDPHHPVALANGDLQYLDLIAQEMPALDIFGSNMYRGISFTNAWTRVKEELGLPMLVTEFGADAFNAVELQETQLDQARFVLGQWREIYEQSHGKGRCGNAIGGTTFQFSDGWWKYLQESNLDIHDANASWGNGGYPYDYVEGRNNMNEEWWGLCAKGSTDARGMYTLYPRAAYYALAQVHQLDPLAAGVDSLGVQRHFASISAMEALTRARGDRAALVAESQQQLRVSGLRMELESIYTGGRRVSTPDRPVAGGGAYPSFRGADRLESFYMEVEAQPAGNVRGTLSLNVLGHVPENPIDEIFYENRGRTVTVRTPGAPVELPGLERVKVHQASVSWQHSAFDAEGFYRTGHYHWGYEGDFFGLYQEANYGPNIDMYNGDAPLGVELTGKGKLDGLKLAAGPQLWWGANPAALVKARRRLGPLTATLVYQEDLDNQGSAVSTMAIPLPPTRKATLHLEATRGSLGLEAGAIWSGANKVDETFQVMEGAVAMVDRVKATDALGAKARLTWRHGRVNAYAQGALMGVVAAGGPTAIQTYTGWHLKDTGSGNQVNALTGFTWGTGNLQVGPNLLWQKPIVGPMPAGMARNVLADPFAVRANRETLAGEVLLTWDPTPATWFYAWNNDEMEDAPLAISAGVIYRHQPTTQDGSIGFLSDGSTTFAFTSAPPARDLWEAHARIVAKSTPGRGMIATLYAGTGEPNGNDPRVVHRYGAEARILLKETKLVLGAKLNDWGPYDYHRDFNLTFPVQLSADASLGAGRLTWWQLPGTRLGIRGTWRSLDRYSPRYCPATTLDALGEEVCDPEAPGARRGSEWEIRSYLHFSL
jgi:hypothetical protein